MKIAFTASGNDLSAPLDSRFGRAETFIVYDLDSGDFSAVANTQNLRAAQGAGIQSAQRIVEEGVGAVVTGHCGPKAFKVLRAAGVAVFATAAATVESALAEYRAGRLEPLAGADVEGHWI